MLNVELKVPLTVVSKVDVAKLMREIIALNDFLVAASNRKTGQPMTLPKLSRSLEEVATQNKLNLLDENNRKELYSKLSGVMNKSPQIHMSFASEPSAKAIQRILEWLRANIHTNTLLQIGLQPNIAAGAVVRTPNLFFDLSLRHYLVQQEPYLSQLLRGDSSSE